MTPEDDFWHVEDCDRRDWTWLDSPRGRLTYWTAMQVALSLDHPLLRLIPTLEDCPTADDIYFELLKYELAISA